MIPEYNVEALQNEIDGDVQTAYVKLLQRGDVDMMRVLLDKTGVKCAARKEEVQHMYDIFLKMNDGVFQISRLEEVSGVKPEFSEKAVHSAYYSLMSKSKVNDFIYMAASTKVRPVFGEHFIRMIQNAYTNTCWESESDNESLFLVSGLYEFTGIAPDKRVADAISSEWFLEERPKTLKKMVELMLAGKLGEDLEKLRRKKE